MPNDDYSKLIDPADALELLPQKIKERKRLISGLALDLQAFKEAGVPEADIKTVEDGIRYNSAIVSVMEKNLDAIRKAINGTT